MKILGLSSNYHDASAALVVDGEVRFAAAEERFSRQKHDPNFPMRSIRAGLAAAGVRSEDIDFAVYHEDPYNKLSRTLASTLSRWPLSLGSFLLTGRDAVTSGLRIHQEIAGQLNIDPRKVLFAPHHMSHAALAFLASNLDEAAVMTIDAVGEWTSSAIFQARREGANLKMEPLHVSPFPHSLGLFYSAITSYLGFKVNDGECSTMALAAFGQPKYVNEMRNIVRVTADGEHHLDLSYFNFRSDSELPVTEKFLKIFGPNRDFKSKLPFDCLTSNPIEAADDMVRFADVAASAQLALEEAVIAYSKKARSLTGQKNLCYAGGVALNCVANEKLQRHGDFDSVFIPPDPGDGGAALGAALYVAGLKGELLQRTICHPYQGNEYSSTEMEEILPHLEPTRWPPFSPLATRGRIRLKWRQLSDSELIAAAADKVNEGRIVGWFQGRFEQGPRALGARSILIRADSEDLARRLSTRVKKRAAFRPYALSMTESAAARVLDIHTNGVPRCARWMQTSTRIRDEFRGPLRYGLHVDQTTRPQVVDESQNPLFASLLRKYGEKSGIEALINTSFNEAGSPLVASPLDALMMFARTEMDALVVGRTMIEKDI